MGKYYSKHRHFIFLWLALMLIAGISGYFVYPKKVDLKENQYIPNNLEQKIKKEESITPAKKIETVPDKKSNLDESADPAAKATDVTIDTQLIIPRPAEPEIAPSLAIDATGTLAFTFNINGKTIDGQIAPGATVHQAMQNLMTANNTTFHAAEYPGIGYFVDEIDGIKNDPKEGLYWIYYINGQSAKVGISLYSLKPNDLITWKYEKSKF